ncbi:EsV-1-147 [Ectocarpus siliculosus virus 1]|uniref:EsV-1-147 n=1 Tax=Ectocarpus siliculosus virus 1 (isolate New Zealand/Kaikoura/1988) TaxID=654926 RepID=Q8QND5_ESV1K|nr:EsV-1-147 [Ectocarpus siliculosus virus 1]AAK14562.1 EsV-1-147 [Ectocarpus siliculosus virus 1]
MFIVDFLSYKCHTMSSQFVQISQLPPSLERHSCQVRDAWYTEWINIQNIIFTITITCQGMTSSNTERLEVSIFREDKNKTMISSIMNPRVRGGMGTIMLDIARDVTARVPTLCYTGRAWTISRDLEYTLSDEDVVMNFKTCTYLFGGSVYQIHAENDKSRFSHILPGIHDIDLLCEIFPDPSLVARHGGGYGSNQELARLFDPPVVEDLLRKKHDDVLNQPGPMPYVLRELVSTVRKRLKSVTPKKYYYRKTDAEPYPDEIEIIPSVLEPDSEELIYQEIVDEIFLIRVAHENINTKIQVEVRGQMGDFVGHDHVLEIIFDQTKLESRIDCGDLVKVNGIFVDSKKNLFHMNMMSGFSRLTLGKELSDIPGQESESHHAFGKCALDVLRLTYIILTDLDSASPWVTTPVYDRAISVELPISFKGTAMTPISYFIVYMAFMAPCVDRSGVGRFQLHDDVTVEGSVNPRASVLMGEILRLFSELSSTTLKEETAKLSKIIQEGSESRTQLFRDRGRDNTMLINKADRIKQKQTNEWALRDFDLETDATVRSLWSGGKYHDTVLFQNRSGRMYVTLDGTNHFHAKKYRVRRGNIEFTITSTDKANVDAVEFNYKVVDILKNTQNLGTPLYLKNTVEAWRNELFDMDIQAVVLMESHRHHTNALFRNRDDDMYITIDGSPTYIVNNYKLREGMLEFSFDDKSKRAVVDAAKFSEKVLQTLEHPYNTNRNDIIVSVRRVVSK